MSYGKIALIVPVYNCEKYLRHCIESILAQTYSDLELFIVDDESSDESFKIALEYAKKDPRITLICKENRGQGAARNAALAYIFGDFELENGAGYEDLGDEGDFNKTNASKEGVSSQEDFLKQTQPKAKYHKSSNTGQNKALYEFKVKQNPKNLSFVSEIKALYSAKNLQNESKFSFVEFIDGDDFLSLDCIRQSLENMGQSDILWFDYEPFFDGVKKRKFHRQMHEFGYFKNEKISIFDLLDRASERKIPSLWFAWQGVLRFDFLQKNGLYFLNEHYGEDVDFAIRAFTLAKSIQTLAKPLYFYRIRAGSSMNFKPKRTILPPYLSELARDFDNDTQKAKSYQMAMSLIKVCLSLINFIKNLEDKHLASRLEKQFLPFLCNKALMIELFKKDPKNMRLKLEPLKDLIAKQPSGAVQRTKQYLRYKLAKNSTAFKGLKKPFVFLAFARTIYTHQREQKAYKMAVKKDFSLKKDRIEIYSDYISSLRLKKMLSLSKLLKFR